jgi:hypothetical protein
VKKRGQTAAALAFSPNIQKNLLPAAAEKNF